LKFKIALGHFKLSKTVEFKTHPVIDIRFIC